MNRLSTVQKNKIPAEKGDKEQRPQLFLRQGKRDTSPRLQSQSQTELKYNHSNLVCPRTVRMSVNQTEKNRYLHQKRYNTKKKNNSAHINLPNKELFPLKSLSKGILLPSCGSVICSQLRFQQTRQDLTNPISWKQVLLSPAGWLVWACWSVLSERRYMKQPGKLAAICKAKKPKCCCQ